MAVQIPLAQYGLEEAVEQFMVEQLQIIMLQYTGQQTDTVVNPEVVSLFTKLQEPQYPFLGIRAHIPDLTPTFFGDFIEQVQFSPAFPVNVKTVGQFNDCEINVHVESKVYREIQRISSYLTTTVEFGYDLVNSQPYLTTLQQFGIISMGWRQSPVTRKIQDSLQRDGDDRNVRTDIETLFQRDLYLKCNVNLNIQVIPGPAIIFIEYLPLAVTIQIPS